MPVLRRHALKLALALLLAALPGTAQAQIDHEQRPYGSVCSGTGNGADWDTVFECNGSTWQRGPYFFGSSPDSCDSSHAGMVQWTGSAFQGCNGSVWGSLGGGGASALSALLAATTTNSIDNANWAQTWKWGTLSTGTALTLTSSSMTTGSLLSLQDTAIAATSTGKVLSLSDTTTGPGYGVYSLMSGLGNTGYAGYFANTDTGAANYGLYASTSSSSGYAIYASGSTYLSGTTTVSGNLVVTGTCTGCGGTQAYDLSMFYPGTVSSSAIVRVTSARVATYPTGLTGSYCVAKEGATSSTTITIKQIHAGSSTSVGTVVFGSGGGTNVTNCTFTAASGISLAAGDALEFAFPATPDATLGDVTITVAGTHN
jgi:hypothetical protein